MRCGTRQVPMRSDMPVSAKRQKVKPKHYTTIKSAEGIRSMEMFLDYIHKHERESNTSKSEVVASIRSSSILVNAMLRCHERFVRIVASELTDATISAQDRNENSAKVHRIGEQNVQKALKDLGMEEIFLKMKRSQAVGCASTVTADCSDLSNRRKQRKGRRVKQWTEEEITEQERLLASSKEKMLCGGD